MLVPNVNLDISFKSNNVLNSVNMDFSNKENTVLNVSKAVVNVSENLKVNVLNVFPILLKKAIVVKPNV